MVEYRFPDYASRVEYWEGGDLPWASPARAVEKMTQVVQAWVEMHGVNGIAYKLRILRSCQASFLLRN
jgi:hypothetical protein